MEEGQSRENAFWKGWRRDYLSLLHDRSKWRRTKDDLKSGDVVILVDETVGRSRWEMGRVVDVVDSGTHVRKVNVRKKDKKVVIKDRTKVVKLELDG